MGRYTRIPDYQAGFAYGGCYLCRASKRADEDFVIDTHVDVDGEGYMAICIPCATEIGDLVGLVDVKRLDKAMDRYRVAEANLKAAEKALAEREELVSLLQRSLDEVEAVKA